MQEVICESSGAHSCGESAKRKTNKSGKYEQETNQSRPAVLTSRTMEDDGAATIVTMLQVLFYSCLVCLFLCPGLRWQNLPCLTLSVELCPAWMSEQHLYRTMLFHCTLNAFKLKVFDICVFSGWQLPIHLLLHLIKKCTYSSGKVGFNDWHR